jgi:hypothetical protein
MACGPNMDRADCSLVDPGNRRAAAPHPILRPSGDALTACPSGFGRRWLALQGVAHLGEGRLEVQRLVLAMGDQEVALDVEGPQQRFCG